MIYQSSNSNAAPPSLEGALRAHIGDGIDMLREGAGLAAYRHFQSSYGRPGLERIDVSGGMIFPITCLLSEEDVVFAASTVAHHSRTFTRGAEIGGWHTGGFTTDFSDTSKYNPDLVRKFHQETGIVAAEEWLHILQSTVAAPIADQDDAEVDVAAYFVREGLELSADFLTRYGARTEWYVQDHPERKDELLDFGRKFGRFLFGIV